MVVLLRFAGLRVTPDVDALAVMPPRSAGLRVTPDVDALAVMPPRSAGAKGDAGC
ncbi:TPA: hypothetical protein U5E27_004032 [Yersinia enterocolitica]|nr:hypothetical protein [Yersinia enterocolitica]